MARKRKIGFLEITETGCGVVRTEVKVKLPSFKQLMASYVPADPSPKPGSMDSPQALPDLDAEMAAIEARMPGLQADVLRRWNA